MRDKSDADRDFTIPDAETARDILHYLGFASDVSMEPFVDRKRDHIARLIRDQIEGQSIE